MSNVPMIDKPASLVQLAVELRLDGTDPLVSLLPGLWDAYADKQAVYPRLQYYYARRQALFVLLQRVVQERDWEREGVTDSRGDIFTHWQTLQTINDGLIKDLETKAVASRPPSIAPMTTTQPGCVPPFPFPNPASGYFRGLPYAWPAGPAAGGYGPALPLPDVTESDGTGTESDGTGEGYP